MRKLTRTALAGVVAVTALIVSAGDACAQGVTAVRRTALTGPNGGVAVHRGRNTLHRGGGATHASGGAVRLPDGRAAARMDRTAVHRDGSVTRTSGFAAAGPNGSVVSGSTAHHGLDGSASRARVTAAVGSDGSTYHGSTTWTAGAGVQHTSTCTDASGNAIPCGRR